MNKKKKGFTLVEVLIVVVIIAVLASLVIPRFVNQSSKAKAAEAINMMSTIRRAALSYYDENRSWLDNADADAIKANFNIDFTEKDWIFSTGVNGTIQAVDATGVDQIFLDSVTGRWNGTGEFAPNGVNCNILKNCA